MGEDQARGTGGAATLDVGRLAKKVFVVTVLAELAWVVGDVVFNFFDLLGSSSIQKIFNIAREESVPTWFSSILLLASGLVLVLIAFNARRREAGKWTVRGWIALAVFFVYMSVDDAAVIHERVGTWLGDLAEGSGSDETFMVPVLEWFRSYHWQVFLGPFFAAFGVFMVVFLWRHMGRYSLRRYFILGLACWTTAVAIDYVEGIDTIYDDIAEDLGWKDYTVSHFAKVTEETVEMFGMTLFLVGFLRQLGHEAAGLTLQLRGRSG